MDFKAKCALLLATGAGAGYMPKAPGTFGSLWGLALAYALSRLGRLPSFAVAALFIGLAIAVAGYGAKALKRKDPGCIVIDEIAGMAVTLLGLPFSPALAAGGFVLFRVLDICKPFPVNWADRRLAGGWGIVFDDVIAGAIGNLILRAALLAWG